jgi:phage-related protein
MDDEKQIRWVGSAYDDLLAFPKDARKEAGFQSGKVQAGLEPADWKPFDDDVRRQVRGSHLHTALFPEEDAVDQQER